jgi:hypothetical protein
MYLPDSNPRLAPLGQDTGGWDHHQRQFRCSKCTLAGNLCTAVANERKLIEAIKSSNHHLLTSMREK